MDNGEPSPPSPPPKHVPPPLSLDPALHPPLLSSPQTPSSPARKQNPLTDLIDSERSYVDQLTGIIRKVAAAWSRSNLPPPELDTMFRSVEGVYKASRAFHAVPTSPFMCSSSAHPFFQKLKEIGINPSNPKALGDLLMRWIDDLKGPYLNYCSKYCCGFDSWEPIRSNAKLGNILIAFSASNPPPSSTSGSDVTSPPTWTLDDLFLLPKARLKYYKKLYGRLLKSTAPGKSDYKLLVGALETLDLLLATLESRGFIRVGNSDAASSAPPPPHEPVDEVVIDFRTRSVIEQHNQQTPDLRLSADTHVGSESSSARSSSVSGGESFSRETPTTPISRVSSATLSTPISDLERRLSTERTLDIFTMKSKIVRLQMASSSLTFTRELRLSMDVVIRFTSQATGVEVVHSSGHICLLSDLFLVAEKMTPQEKSLHGEDGADMWLSYPPLAGKVLRVFEIPEQPKSLRLVIMRKETLFIETDSMELRDSLLAHFRDCIEFSRSLPPPSKVPPPPVPPLNVPFRTPINSPPSNPSSSNPINSRSPSPHNHFSQQVNPAAAPPPNPNPPPYRNNEGALESMRGPPQPLGNGQNQQGVQRAPSVNNIGQPVPYGNGPMPVQGPSRTTSSSYQGPSRSAGPPIPPGPGSIFPSHGPNHVFGPGPVPSGVGPGFNGPGPGLNGPGPAFNGHGPAFNGPGPAFNGPGPALNGPGPGFNGPGPALNGPGPGFNGPGPGFNGPGPTRVPGANYGPAPGRHSPSGPLHNPPVSSHVPPPFQSGVNQPNLGNNGLPPGARPPNPYPPIRPPSEPGVSNGPPFAVRKSPSSRSIASEYSNPGTVPPPVPPFPGGNAPSLNYSPRISYNPPLPPPILPSLQHAYRSVSMIGPSPFDEPSPPNSPVQETPPPVGPVTSTISAQMKCKVFLQQQHAQWKSLGSAKLKLYRQDPTNIKQLVVEADNKGKSIIISTIVLTDGVERVGKTGVAIELSDKGQRTGIIYMIQLRNETSAGGLFDSLLQGSDRAARN
ncbi:hypothetical protein C0993_005347 [Termitomyces sp. T159_Od127]|nr:hypothetical protein C0993_005347 [Termitomyces sp. T159_Od127]